MGGEITSSFLNFKSAPGAYYAEYGNQSCYTEKHSLYKHGILSLPTNDMSLFKSPENSLEIPDHIVIHLTRDVSVKKLIF